MDLIHIFVNLVGCSLLESVQGQFNYITGVAN